MQKNETYLVEQNPITGARDYKKIPDIKNVFHLMSDELRFFWHIKFHCHPFVYNKCYDNLTGRKLSQEQRVKYFLKVKKQFEALNDKFAENWARSAIK